MKLNINNIWSFVSGAIIGILGGLIGLGGAEFRLPLLVGIFKFATIQGIIMNLVVSIVTVTFSFIFRSSSIPFGEVFQHYTVILNLLAGSMTGAFVGVRLSSKFDAKRLDNIVFIFLLLLGVFMVVHSAIHFEPLVLPALIKVITGFLAGLVIGIFSSMLGVAGGELIIPAIIILFGIDIKLAGSLSLCISFPTVLVGIMKYRQNQHFKVVGENKAFVLCMILGSALGAFVGSRVLKGINVSALQIILGVILLVSAIKTFKKTTKKSEQ